MKYKIIKNIITCDKCGVNKDIEIDMINIDEKDLCNNCYEEFKKLKEEKELSILEYLLTPIK